MQTISLYKRDRKSKESKKFDSVDISDSLFKTLAQSDFSQLGESKKTEIIIEEETQNLLLVCLTKGIRRSLKIFLYEFIVTKTEESFKKMGSSPSSSEFESQTHDVKSLIKILRLIENKNFSHLQRINA